MRLIDIDKLMETGKVVIRGEDGEVVAQQFIALLKNAHTVDAVPVVRCRDCKSYNKPRPGWCEVHLDTEPADGYCYWAKRKDGDVDG